jgi:hypothetical protein
MQNLPYASCSERRWLWLCTTALLLWAPGVGGLLKHSMLSHMLVQLSALVLVGYGLGATLLRTHPRLSALAHTHRWACLITAVTTMSVWMIPRLLDSAVENPWVDAVKALSLVLMAGVPLALAWRRLPVTARCLLHVEALATLWRLGWLYLESPIRLCNRYDLDDQWRLGYWMLALGAVYCTYLACVALAGVGTTPSTPPHA